MSMKSFDKFCERLITAEPGSQKEILDERQKIARLRTSCETLAIFSTLMLVNLMFMEELFCWCESYTAASAVFIVLGMLEWIIMNIRRGSLFGVNGTGNMVVMGYLLLIYAAIFAANLSGEEFSVVRDGMLTKDFIIACAGGILLVCAVIIFISARKNKLQSLDK